MFCPVRYLSWLITLITMVYDTYNYSIHGVCKPTFTSHLGAPHCIKLVARSPIFSGPLKNLFPSSQGESKWGDFGWFEQCTLQRQTWQAGKLTSITWFSQKKSHGWFTRKPHLFHGFFRMCFHGFSIKTSISWWFCFVDIFPLRDNVKHPIGLWTVDVPGAKLRLVSQQSPWDFLDLDHPQIPKEKHLDG